MLLLIDYRQNDWTQLSHNTQAGDSELAVVLRNPTPSDVNLT